MKSTLRFYQRLDADSPNAVAQGDAQPDYRADPAYYVPNESSGTDPEAVNPRYHIRGNGVRDWKPALAAADLDHAAHAVNGIRATDRPGVEPIRAGLPGEIVFKVEGANVITSLTINAVLMRKTADDVAAIAVSTNNGIKWQEVWCAEKTGETPIELHLVEPVNGAYEVLVRVTLMGHATTSDAQLQSIAFRTVTQVNGKTLPQLRLGKNTVCVAAGEQTASIVLCPDLSTPSYKSDLVEERNVVQPEQAEYQASLCAERGGDDAYVVFRIDAPSDITGVTYGGRFYNRGAQAHIDQLHSFDGGQTWLKSYSLTDTTPPWDVIHYEQIGNVPPGTRSVLFKYFWSAADAGRNVCGLYAVRMEARHRPAVRTRGLWR